MNINGKNLKRIGIVICGIGSLLAGMFVPTKLLGMSVGWHFIFGDAVLGFRNYHLLDTSTLFLELILINGVGMALFFVGVSKTAEENRH